MAPQDCTLIKPRGRIAASAMNSALPSQRSPFRGRLFWLFQVTFWMATGLFQFILVTNFSPSPDNLWIILHRNLAGFIICLVLAYIYGKPFMMRQRLLEKYILALIFTLIVTLICLRLFQVLIDLEMLPDFRNAPQLRGMPAARFLFLLFWNALYFTFESRENLHQIELRAAAAETAAKDNELKLLQAQMNPHFLFNALNAINAHNDNPVVTDMVQHLAIYLRFSLTPCRSLEPLSRELDALESYLTVQALRFGEQMQCSINCDTASHAMLVPPMMIQPLLENAFNYGAQTSPAPLRIAVSTRVDKGLLKITVANSGSWVEPGRSAFSSTGTGIRSLRKRLELLSGQDARLDIEKTDGWVRVHIQMPATLTLAPS